MENWSKCFTEAPRFTINELESFFEKSGKTGKTQKRAENLLFDNFLDSVSTCYNNNFFYIRSICSASYTKSQVHQLSCCISKSNAEVLYAYCTCKAGKGGFCNHIYGLLKLIAQFVLDKVSNIPHQLPCTSRPCGWTVPKVRKMNVRKDTVMETEVKKPKLGQKRPGIKCTLYEARAPHKQTVNFDDIDSMKENLCQLNPNIPIVSVLRSSVKDDEWTDTKFGSVPIYSPLAYQCSKLGNNFKVYLNIDNLNPLNVCPRSSYPDFPHRDIPQYFQYDTSILTQAEQSVLQKIKLTNEQAVAIERMTRKQSADSLWFMERKLRVTASKIYDVYQWKRGLEKHAEKFVSADHDLTVCSDILRRKLEHGRMYEPVALHKYQECVKEANKAYTVEVSDCGLVLSPRNCWLGCSPDGKVVFGDLYGIIECKCPEQYKLSDLYDVSVSGSNNCMLLVENGKLNINKNHSTYFQIQCQLALTGAAFCDLTVYTFVSIAIIRITFDPLFWDNVVQLVGQKYFQYLLKEYANYVALCHTFYLNSNCPQHIMQ